MQPTDTAILRPLLILVFSILLILSLKTQADFGLWPVEFHARIRIWASGEFRAESLSVTQEIFYLYYKSKLGRGTWCILTLAAQFYNKSS